MTPFLLYLNFALMLLLPVLLASWIQRRWRPGWALFGIGAVTFVLSQVGHIPFNAVVQQLPFYPDNVDTWTNLLLVAGFLGLSAGVFEEVARYLTYRYWAKKARTWQQGMMLGAGHGGIEAILVALLGVVNVSVLLLVRSGSLQELIPVEQMPLLQQQIDGLFNAPWYELLLGAVERVWALTFHLAASLLVMQVFVRRQWRWLLAAIGLHTLFNGVAVVVVTRYGALAAEATLGVTAVLSLYIILRLRRDEPERPQPETLPPPEPPQRKEVETSPDKLDESRYT